MAKKVTKKIIEAGYQLKSGDLTVNRFKMALASKG